jgi:hypothetical protein
MKYLIAIILLASTAFAQNNSGTLVIAPIRPQASNDTFPSAIANEIKGGPFSVATTTAMSNIPNERLVAGSLAYVTNDGLFRIYDGTNWSLTNIQNAFNISNTTSLTNISGVLAISNGGTGATNAGGARTNLGIPSYFGSGTNSAIAGGEGNLSAGNWAFVGGGLQNVASNSWATVSGGYVNVASGESSSVGGGVQNNASGISSSIGGGDGNTASALGAFVGGGRNNKATNADTAVVGGYGNIVNGQYGFIGGGLNNTSSAGAVVVGGISNVASGYLSSIVGGTRNIASGEGSFAAGSRAKSTNDGSFVWADGAANDFSSTANNQFIVRASGGVGINTGSTFEGSFHVNGTTYGTKTNVGPFEGIGNFFASNNTTIGNETLFRVGVAETTNKSAQFGFRVARTNNGGEGLAVFSVFGYNALMMIGPSDRSRSNSLTNTNAAIEADIWTMSETNRVMTLRDTNTGATVMHRPIGFNTNEVSTTAPSNTTVTNPTGWIQIYVGTNSVRVPYYQ